MEENDVVLIPSEDSAEVTETVVESTVSESRTIMNTPLDDYTVSEGLLLVLCLSVFGIIIGRMLKGVISWLMW